MLLFRNQMKLFVNKFMGLFCYFPFYNNFSALYLKVILLRVAILAMLNIMIREQAVLN